MYQIHDKLVKTFRSGVTLPLSYRRHQLLQLARMFQENKDAFYRASQEDISRHRIELNITEIVPIITGALRAAESLEDWNRPEKPEVEEWRKNYDTTLYKAPKGIVLIIGYVPWPIRTCATTLTKFTIALGTIHLSPRTY